MPGLRRSTVFTGYLNGATGPVSAGTALLYNTAGTRLIVATDANRTATGRVTAGICLDDGDDDEVSVEVQFAGPLPPSVTGLGTGTATTVYVDANGALARGDGSEDDVVGECDTDGTVYLLCGGLYGAGGGGGGATPGGSTGSVQANDGAGGFTGYANVLLGSGFISIGTTVATDGAIRLAYGTQGIYARNSTNNDNVSLLALLDGTSMGLGTDLVQFGDGAYNVLLVPGVGRTLHVWSDDGKINDGNGSEVASWNSYGFQFGKTTPDFGMGQGVIGLQNTLLAPSTNPTDGIIIYAEGNVLKYRTPAGTVVALSGSSSVLTLPQINDTSSDHQYVFAVSELAADRTVTLPLLTGDDTFVFQAHTQTLTNKTLTSPTIGGTPIVTATTTTANGNSKVTITDAIANVQTTNATETNLYTFSIPDEAVTCVDVLCTAVQSTAAAGASYKRTITFISDGGTVTVVGSLRDNQTDEDSSAWDFTVDNSFSTCRVIVTGEAATTIQWGAAIRIQTTVP
jgi:hypothetical protein